MSLLTSPAIFTVGTREIGATINGQLAKSFAAGSERGRLYTMLGNGFGDTVTAKWSTSGASQYTSCTAKKIMSSSHNNFLLPPGYRQGQFIAP